MAYAEASVPIKKTVSEVFQFILNAENNILWRPMIMDIKRKLNTEVGVGTVFIQGIKGPNGIRINADFQIIECEKDKKIVFQVLNGPHLPIGTYIFETKENETRLTFSMNDKSSVDSEKRLHLQNVVNSIEDLKKYLELNTMNII